LPILLVPVWIPVKVIANGAKESLFEICSLQPEKLP